MAGFARAAITGSRSRTHSDSEDLLGKWFKKTGNRSKIFLATKFGNCSNDKGERWVDSTPEYVKKACAKSLERLGIDQIDLYYWWVRWRGTRMALTHHHHQPPRRQEDADREDGPGHG